MPKRFVSVILIFALSALALGESLHALPFFDHHSEAKCESSDSHFDSTRFQSDSDCGVCNALMQFQVLPVHGEIFVRILSETQAEPLKNSILYTSDVIVSDSRGPPPEVS
jgi:hypothetical protein